MNTELLERLQIVFRNVFRDPALVISPEYTAADIPGWESLTHMMLISETEAFFSVTFTFEEVSKFKTIGDMVQLIAEKKENGYGK